MTFKTLAGLLNYSEKTTRKKVRESGLIEKHPSLNQMYGKAGKRGERTNFLPQEWEDIKLIFKLI